MHRFDPPTGYPPPGGYPPPHSGYPPPPGQPPYPGGYAAAAPRRRRIWPWFVGGFAALLVVGLLIAPRQPAATSTPVAAPTSTPLGTPTGPAFLAEPTSTLPPVPAGPARKLSARDWLLVAKDPAGHAGAHVIVYGQVTQFDSATGTESFRASVDGVEHKPKYGFADYDTNTIVTGQGATLASVVQGDLFRAEAVVIGPFSYATTLGGQTTVPSLFLTNIEVIGHLD